MGDARTRPSSDPPGAEAPERTPLIGYQLFSIPELALQERSPLRAFGTGQALYALVMQDLLDAIAGVVWPNDSHRKVVVATASLDGSRTAFARSGTRELSANWNDSAGRRRHYYPCIGRSCDTGTRLAERSWPGMSCFQKSQVISGALQVSEPGFVGAPRQLDDLSLRRQSSSLS